VDVSAGKDGAPLPARARLEHVVGRDLVSDVDQVDVARDGEDRASSGHVGVARPEVGREGDDRTSPIAVHESATRVSVSRAFRRRERFEVALAARAYSWARASA